LSGNGKLVEDTRAKNGNDSAPEVKIGSFTVTKCLDIALPQMKPGQKFKIDCPAKFAYGSASPFGMESDHIPENSDLTYEVEVIACT
jgi:FKBP-type peptidyl-prolyl cis-trans isomerase